MQAQYTELPASRHPAPLVMVTGRAINELLTTEEAAQLVGCSPRHIARLCQRGDLPARKIGADWRIDPRDLATYKLPPLGRPRVSNPRHDAQKRHERYLRQRARLHGL